MRGVVLAFAMIGFPVMAETPMTIEQFEAAVTGKRIAYYDRGQQLIGIEQYSPGRVVRWAAPGLTTCMEGVYYAKGDWICFDYPQYVGGADDLWAVRAGWGGFYSAGSER